MSPSRTSKSTRGTPVTSAVIDTEANAALASSAVWRALTAAASDVSDEWPHREHGATSPADVRTSLAALAENVRQALNGDSIVLGTFPPFVPVRRAP